MMLSRPMGTTSTVINEAELLQMSPMSLASAVIIELPLAFVMLNSARRLIRLSALVAMSLRGADERVPSLRRIPPRRGRGK